MNIIKSKDTNMFFMKTVYEVSKLSKDPRTKIGSVLVRDGDIISIGYNNFPRKVLDLSERYEDIELKHNLVLHSEENSILNAARKGTSTLNSILFTNGVPCVNCSKSVINAGVIKIVVHKQWPNLIHSEKWVKSIKLSLMILEEAGVELEYYDNILNVVGFLDGKEINC